MGMFIDFVMSRFGISKITRDIQKINFIIKKILPKDNPEISIKRLKNLFLSFIAWRYGFFLGDIKPIILQVETVSGCNFNCIMCRAGSLKKEFMTYDEFEKILYKIPEAFVIIMNLAGEPFLSKDTLKLIRYASLERKAIVNIFSNFSVLPDPYEVLNSGLYEIHASIDTFDPIKFSKIREGGKLEKVISNLETLIETRKKIKKSLPIISINAVCSEETIEDTEDIILNAIKIGVDRVKFQRLLFDIPELHSPSQKSQQYLLYLKKKYKDKIDVILNNFENIGDKSDGYCYLAYFMLAIKVNGDVYPCCMPYPNFFPFESIMGNIFASNNSWNKKRMEFVSNFRDSPPNFCQICPLYYRK